MMKITVKGKPGDYFAGGRVQWDGKVVGSVIEVEPSGEAVCEVNDEIYEKLFAMEFTSMGCAISDMN